MILGGGACLYTYCTFSVFADVSMFIVGWWLSLLTAILLSFICRVRNRGALEEYATARRILEEASVRS